MVEQKGVNHPFNKETKLAGKGWYYGFISRPPELSLRLPEATSLRRAKGFNKIAVGKFFENLLCIQEREQLPAARIYNVDETGMSTVNDHKKFLL
jgi:hypothetical protein